MFTISSLASRRAAGFSLIEVVLSLGVVSFCLITLLGLVPAGLNAYSNASLESGAANCLRQISFSIQDAVPDGSGNYEAYLGTSNISWSLNGQTVTKDLPNLSAGGLPTDNTAGQALVAHVEIDSPRAATTSGTAYISVAWSKQAQWNATTRSWKNARGFVSTSLVFLPGQ